MKKSNTVVKSPKSMTPAKLKQFFGNKHFEWLSYHTLSEIQNLKEWARQSNDLPLFYAYGRYIELRERGVIGYSAPPFFGG